ncbi:hypothetical protein CIL05_00185 [Virgibacillus profundi]|uniref:Sulfate exporter family transporter n=1 Tax=Virgibacillus profundi TaxID=2024555 RepID=A0A2A2IJ37_9BACI|nr:putative sulfate exporter family transporter [Virgibacillus profundi]PAV31113.1 hypothetical protein CIL05_00185 [Virgibacillus profundi]PXY55296.1 putative sulfate exporter family transporter [Virgibacillus profundi]
MNSSFLSNWFQFSKFKKVIPGLLLVMVIALVASFFGDFIPYLNSTILAILIGAVLSNIVNLSSNLNEGISFSQKKVLKLAIILLGVSLNLWNVISIGGSALIPITVTVILGVVLTFYIGKFFGLTNNLNLLIGGGTAICGATAIATISPVLKAKEEETAYAISTIFIFNIISVIIYPIIGQILNLSDEFFGVWSGVAIHDTSSVVAAAYEYNDESGIVATVVKMTRTLFLIPLVLILGFYTSKKGENDNHKVSIFKIFPVFLLFFLLMSILNTLGVFSEQVVNILTVFSKFFILMAMVSIGLSLNVKKLSKLGMAPIYTGLIASVIVALVSFITISMALK